jgi:hypothetical protein
MEKEFVPYELALRMKALGFDEPCFAWSVPNNENFIISPCEKYNGRQSLMTQIPLYQQAFRWLYQKLDIEKGVMPLDVESQHLLLNELLDKVIY